MGNGKSLDGVETSIRLADTFNHAGKPTRLGLVAATCAIFLGVAMGPKSVSSQEIQSVEDPDAEVCMMRVPNGERPSGRIFATLPASNAAVMAARGFQIVPCARAFSSVSERQAWRDSVCDLASDPREAFQNEIESVLGVRAAALCGMAEATSGQWQRRGRRGQ